MIEGKTKIIVPGPETGTVLLESKDSLTGGDAARVAAIPSIGILKTTQTVNVFELLREAGIPTAFIRQRDERTILCWACDMLPVEFVLRRRPWGSYLKRHPDQSHETSFEDLVVERFHKQAMVLPPASEQPRVMDEGAARAEYLRDGIWAEGVYTDPLIKVNGQTWTLLPPKQPISSQGPSLDIPAPITEEQDTFIVETLLKPAFLALEKAWAGLTTQDGPIALIDCKFEVGVRTSDSALILSDVIDNDSWRIWPGGDPTKQLDKQAFRDGGTPDVVADLYRQVTDLTNQFPSSVR